MAVCIHGYIFGWHRILRSELRMIWRLPYALVQWAVCIVGLLVLMVLGLVAVPIALAFRGVGRDRARVAASARRADERAGRLTC